MDSQRWDGEADGPRPIIELPDGDVWVGAPEAPSGGRRFRCHLGHVVEVLDSGRIRRVGPGLRAVRPWLLVHGPLEAVIERALAEDHGGHGHAPWEESAGMAGAPVPATPPGLFGLFDRLAALLHRGGAAALPRGEPAPGSAPSSSVWRDTMPWTHPR